jgi:NADH dehydrogenase/NADH:ubiquinone oxidoreductase subunit G
LKKYVGVDVLDSLGSSIRLDVSNNKISRIVPILDESVNEE